MKKYIVITRPAHQAEKLAQGIKAAGGDICLFPTLDIVPTELSEHALTILQHINEYDIIIFISPNAVEYGLKHIPSLPENILLATIGQGSAKSLKNLSGKSVNIVPDVNFNSEGLLSTAAMQNVNAKRILIVRGNGGREHLKEALQKRGADVDYLNVYQRIKPATSSVEIEQHLQNNQIAAIVITSAASLKNLLEMVSEKVAMPLFQTPLLLINQRLVDIASKAGFNSQLLVSEEASDEAIIETLKQRNLLRPAHG